MWDRVIEVLACYGAIVALFVATAQFSLREKTLEERHEIVFTFSRAWACIAFGAGLIYVLAGPMMFR